MNDHPFESLPPAPDDLWPKAPGKNPSVQSQLLSEVFPAPLANVAGTLGRAVHQEIQSTGEYAAKAVMAPSNRRPHEAHLRGVELRFHSRLHAETAAQLLHSYGVVHGEVTRKGAFSLPSPAQLKAAATRTYRTALRDEISLQQQIQVLKTEQPGFDDELYAQLIRKNVPSHGAKFNR
jgi:hypothetical protein